MGSHNCNVVYSVTIAGSPQPWRSLTAPALGPPLWRAPGFIVATWPGPWSGPSRAIRPTRSPPPGHEHLVGLPHIQRPPRRPPSKVRLVCPGYRAVGIVEARACRPLGGHHAKELSRGVPAQVLDLVEAGPHRQPEAVGQVQATSEAMPDHVCRHSGDTPGGESHPLEWGISFVRRLSTLVDLP